MNIFIHVEIAARELDSKLLLAVLAAARGHEVLVSDLNTFISSALSGRLSPGIFHTKSLTPTPEKTVRHQSLKDRNYLITSIDEEGGLIDHNYETDAKTRYSNKTITQASAVFGWSTDDTEVLRQIYPEFSSKIYQTGSPRADLWTKRFSQYWPVPQNIPKKPFLLVSSNMGAANHVNHLHEIIRFDRKAGYYELDSKMFAHRFSHTAENYRMTYAFIEAIRHMATSSRGYDIVLRPHPTENIEAWKTYLDGLPNVHVIREGAITPWVNNSFAVMHNGCTTALEATISGKPVVTYLPFKQQHGRELPNELGERVMSLKSLSDVVDRLFRASEIPGCGDHHLSMPESVAKKIYIDDDELAAEKILHVWEDLAGCSHSRPVNWMQFQAYLKVQEMKALAITHFRSIFKGKTEPPKSNWKFPPMDPADIRGRVKRLQQILGVRDQIECKLLSGRAVLIRKTPS